jgi:hypothetical protein
MDIMAKQRPRYKDGESHQFDGSFGGRGEEGANNNPTAKSGVPDHMVTKTAAPAVATNSVEAARQRFEQAGSVSKASFQRALTPGDSWSAQAYNDDLIVRGNTGTVILPANNNAQKRTVQSVSASQVVWKREDGETVHTDLGTDCFITQEQNGQFFVRYPKTKSFIAFTRN